MLEQFNSFIEEKGLCTLADRVLLAVSGGVDSMVMTDLFHRAGYRFGIAHCNFQLRGKESEEDEHFVESAAHQYDVPFFSTRFCTTEFAETRKISIQMAARELRYEWFEVIRDQDGFDLVATAHHRDDQVETFFINLLRGAGIAGLHGIPVSNGTIIRPLLFTSREEISIYAKKQGILFREDSSNSTLTYARNRIRHQLFPMLHSIDQNYANQITAAVNRIQDAESLLAPMVEKVRKKVVRRVKGRSIIEIKLLRKLKPLQAWMYELLSPFDFNEATIHNITRSIDQESGKTFYSSSHRLVKDRDQLIITEKPTPEQEDAQELYHIHEHTEEIHSPVHLIFRSFSRELNYQISGNRKRATLDYSKLTFPLTLRKWEPGDYFLPYGLNRRKKLSDFFIDEKVPIPDKEACWLLCSGNRIVWVVGQRIDHRFRVSNRTKELLVVDFLP